MIAAGAVSAFAVAGLAAPAHAAPQSLKADKCSLHVSVARPRAGQEETLTVATTAGGTAVRVRIRYRTVSHTWKFTTSASARATRKFGVGRPTPGWKVTLAGIVTGAPKGYRTGAACGTSFTPR